MRQAPAPRHEPDTGEEPEPRQAGGVLVTEAGRCAWEQQLASLRLEKARGVVGQRVAPAPGGGADDDERLDVLAAEAVLEARIADLERLLQGAQVIEDSGRSAAVVAVGVHVGLLDLDTGRSMRLRVVGSHEAGEAGVVSAGSPVGQALLGRPAGAQVVVELPDGTVRRLQIADLGGPEAQPEAVRATGPT